LRPALEEQARGDASVKFFGRVGERAKEELLGACRALALPSRGEGFGLVYLEAMRAGKPCLVSDCDAGREVVNPPEAGLAADPRDAGALAHAAARLLQGGAEWDVWSARARARYEGYFTGSHFQARLTDAMAGLLGEGT
jgi:glycosyltransferase involved in cell wall biosynthesis